MALKSAACHTRRTGEKRPGKHKPLLGSNSPHSHRSCAILGATSGEAAGSHPPAGAQACRLLRAFRHVPAKASLKTRFLAGGNRPSPSPTPAALADGLTADPWGPPPGSHSTPATQQRRRAATRQREGTGPRAPWRGATAAPQSTWRWVTLQSSPAPR